ncbi:DUF3298 domain-containing protein [Cytobacillus firmus]|uniref:DUF3298 domain-containing protein n=1 Tax=Cytobacillus firmus TaxID=1399 RepID=A0A800NAD5_CYTFI|nr:DUF3298 and DUF4163 domain-containing protein [Cytobacillus firmus]KAF0823643.1 hypothetical protein KIS1582_2591 [Cytobacillus firmus]MDD9314040.1 DUF3298 domain-containing protein [Cytobacillus firmus]MED1905490.1 DUF3298 domain-containing protein [Cytobacillus firmus]MED1938668.1 DUF3298 domain-containing protein [Cytobacillus firmus]NUH86339.1 DUF3298 and DUF4163 domain-containing protein [Cytobacillus firmus]
MAINFPVGIKTMTISTGPTKVVYYPRVSGMQNKQLQEFINNTILRQNQQLINEQTGNMDTTVVDLYGYYEIKNNQRNVLSLSLNNYVYHYHAAHGMTVIKSLTFDLQKGKQAALKDLFKPGSDYVKRISDLIAVQIKKRDIPLLVDFTAIKADQDFYIADKALVVYFQLYEITPYAYGFPMFPISVYDLQDIIDENGPLGRMGVN